MQLFYCCFTTEYGPTGIILWQYDFMFFLNFFFGGTFFLSELFSRERFFDKIIGFATRNLPLEIKEQKSYFLELQNWLGQ